MKTSENIDEIALALSKAQAQLTAASKDKSSDVGYSYATLDQVIEIIRKPFADNEICYIQTCGNADEDVTVTTRLIHKSGQFIEDTLKMPVVIPRSNAGKEMMNHAQACGSVITYARRYSLAAIVGIAQEDNDAHSSKDTAKRFSGNDRLISKKQGDYLSDLMSKHRVAFATLQEQYNIERLGELTSAQAKKLIDNLVNTGSINPDAEVANG